MRRFFFAFLFFPALLFSQNQLPYIVGEYSAFDISFGGIRVGSAELSIEGTKEIEGASTFHIVGKGRTSKFFDWFFKVRDVYETYLDTTLILPVTFIRDVYEGGHKIKQRYFFSHAESRAFLQDTSYTIEEGSQDMLSALFYARTFSKSILNQRKPFFIPIFMDEENYFLEILYLYNETINTIFGKINCMVFEPKMQEGRIFKEKESMRIWISNDKNRMLIRAEAEIWVGTIKANLIGYQKTKYPLSIIKEH